MTRDLLPANEEPTDPPLIFGGGFRALVKLAKSMDIQVSVAQITHQMGLGRREPSTEDLVKAAKMLGLRARLIRTQSPQKLSSIPVPALIKLKDGTWHTLRGETGGGFFRVVDPVEKRRDEITLDEVYAQFGGEVILIGKSAAHSLEDLTFGLSWFRPVMKRYRRQIIEILVLSFFVNLLALGYPLSFQLVMDKVVPHKSYSTLVVVIGALVVIAFLSAILNYLRQYLLQHTANRIDVELGSTFYHHLLHLPISFFETKAAGVIVTRARELRSIRNFLTGRAMLTLIDLTFVFVYFALLFVYSVQLACIVLASLPIYFAIGAFMRPRLRRLLRAKFRAFANGQRLLVESIIGVQTVKAAAVEPLFERKWEDRSAAFAKTSFDANLLSARASALTKFVSKVMTAAILFFGIIAVINGKMTIGSLLAFKLIARRASKPILRIAQLYQDFQSVQISIDHVATIFNEEVEPTENTVGLMPAISGEVAFRDVVFRYRPELPPALKNVSLLIQPGEVIGIVGPSGSGKSTLTKLLQRFHSPTSGEIMVDGVDIAHIDLPWLRRQLGVVLQENFLFNQTVHENIAMARPDMPRAQVIRVAKLAGADEFISQLPMGYDTKIEERGANLSGGQRQRLAIARALATNPRILIFDEATSALDYESERIIQNNMSRIVEGRTVIIIAHRLAAVRTCNRIVGMSHGEIVEIGSHAQLLRRRGGLYAHLWSLQNDHLVSDRGRY